MSENIIWGGDKGKVIIKQEDETWFINNEKGGNLKMKSQFITFDGYEVGINSEFTPDEKKALYQILKQEYDTREKGVYVNDTLE